MPRTVALSGAFALVVATASMMSTDARADIYTYVDANGVTHYSNVPPRGSRGVRRIHTDDEPDAPQPPRGGGGGGGGESVAERFDWYDPYIREAAALYRLPESFLRAVMKVESNGNAAVVSPAGACGLMQLMPATAVRMGVTDIFDPRQNILGGARFLRVLANLFNGDLVLTIAAYNAGEGAVIRHRGIPPFEETQRYVRRVLTWYYGFLEAEASIQTVSQ